MTNRNWGFSKKIKDLSDDEISWWLIQRGQIDKAMRECPEKIKNDNSLCPDFVVHPQQKEVWFYSEDGDPIRVANMVQIFIKKFRPHQYFCIKWTRDGKIGGAIFVTIDNIEGFCLEDWPQQYLDDWIYRKEVGWIIRHTNC